MHQWKKQNKTTNRWLDRRQNVQVTSSQRKDFTHNDIIFFFFMLSETKSWSKDFWDGERLRGLVRGKGQSRDEKTKRPGTCHMDRGQRETTSRRGGGGAFWVSAGGGTPGLGRGAAVCWGQRRPEETHILLLLCWGRREGWRNNLDGLGLIKEKERKQTKQHTL